MSEWIRRAALGVAWVWAGFWVLWGLMAAVGMGGSSPVEFLLHLAVPAAPVVWVVWLAGRRARLGGVLLVAVGLLVAGGYQWAASGRSLRHRAPVLLVLAGPAVAAGAALVWCGCRRSGVAQRAAGFSIR